jgi:cation diffusion facilitator CzcD-associated flavoprotein CzcO
MSNVSSTLMKLLEKWARKHLVKSVPDPVLREKLTPNFLIGCKRILISNDYLPSQRRTRHGRNCPGARTQHCNRPASREGQHI